MLLIAKNPAGCKISRTKISSMQTMDLNRRILLQIHFFLWITAMDLYTLFTCATLREVPNRKHEMTRLPAQQFI
ncbi:hypothetical protein AWM70_02070 [Paenibacillus yonginensis]|uniref:Uncharacterized protein n=1 Tax=Paenibacillus yonginensis TaxID=1462996 RepID=A0A1B1MWG2_9BACL|nr:hypothetical protein AWM70_02070 [Paenibacillus yonginensis]